MVFKDECEKMLFDASLLEWLKTFTDRGVFTTNAELKICSWNNWLEWYSGRSAAEVIGRDLLELYPDLQERRLDQHYQDALAGQARTLSQVLHGYLLPLRPVIADLGFPLMKQSAQIMPLMIEGRVVGTITLIEDVTERAATEARLHRQVGELERLSEALGESERWLQTTLHSIGDAVIATDAGGRVVFMNGVAESLTGWPQDEARGQSLELVFQLVDEETSAQVESPVGRVLREGVVVGLANHKALLARNGRQIPIDDSGAPIQNDAGQIVGIVIVFRDVTERRLVDAEREKLLFRERAARAQAEEANRLKDEFLATVSHELRTPLNVMMGWTRILRMGSLNEAEVLRAVETIERSAKAQNQLIEDLLDVSRVITGKLRLDLRPVELSIVVETAIDTMRLAAEAKGIRLDYALDSAVGPILGDADRLQQIVWNLLSNALKFTPQGGSVEVRLQRDHNHAKVVVADTGHGISPEFLPFVFDRFRQADNSFSRQQGGLGLGLAIVRHLVELHGGSTAVHSSGLGMGATFEVRFPLIGFSNLDPLMPEISNSSLSDARTDLDSIADDLLMGVKILVVDDEPDSARLCQVLLERVGAEVRTTTTAANALEILKGWRPDVLVSDIGMPDQDGYELIRQIRTQEDGRGGRLPAIALTAYTKAEDRMRALTAGYQMHVPKPIEPDELTTVIASMSGRLGGGKSPGSARR